ncbi:hypothetical protein U1872_10430 [Sphingomonas sp. RB3P16]|uniref:hypothetical protein n=1 Tax=Parasphingomonas frigoris TaxID=3096163 RepID=UPI002FCA9AF5
MQGNTDTPRWWETRWFVVAAILTSAVPLLWPAFAPLSDMPGHIGRYRIMAEAGRGPLALHYAVDWAPIGNLGVDGLVLLLAPLLGIEPAAKLTVMLIPPLTVAALLWVGREAHGRMPPSALFALPLAYSFPFQLGFVNFALAAALAIGGLALWIRLARTAPLWWRIVLFVPIACLVWLCHSFGWAMLGLFVFGAEWAMRRDAGQGWIRAALLAGCVCAPLALPQAAAMAFAHQPLSGDTGDWFHWTAKLQWTVSVLRERWESYDLISLILLLSLVWLAIRSPRLGFAKTVAVPAVLGLMAFILLPRLYAGGAYVDMRLLPYALALGLAAIRLPPAGPLAGRFALGGGLFFAMRTLGTTAAFALFASGQAAALRALPALPVGSAVLTLVDEPSSGQWSNRRFTHIAGIAIARRRIFTNEQWALRGQQLIRPLHPSAAPLDRDPSQLVYRPVPEQTDFDQAIASFDRGTFGYVWTIGFPVGRAHARDLTPIWSDAVSAVYRVDPRGSPSARPATLVASPVSPVRR